MWFSRWHDTDQRPVAPSDVCAHMELVDDLLPLVTDVLRLNAVPLPNVLVGRMHRILVADYSDNVAAVHNRTRVALAMDDTALTLHLALDSTMRAHATDAALHIHNQCIVLTSDFERACAEAYILAKHVSHARDASMHVLTIQCPVSVIVAHGGRCQTPSRPHHEFWFRCDDVCMDAADFISNYIVHEYVCTPDEWLNNTVNRV